MLEEFLLENWAQLIGNPVPGVIEAVPISSCLDVHGNVIVIIFVDGKSYPEYVMKATRSPLYGFKLINEYHSLKSLSKIKELSSYIPYPFHLGEFDNNKFFIQGGFPGTNLLKLIHKDGLTKTNNMLILESIDLLVKINSIQSESHTYLSNSELPLNHIECHKKELLTAGIGDAKLCEWAELKENFYRAGKTFFLHGDYWQTNILVDERYSKITGIIDWEFSSPDSSVPTDIVCFLLNMAYALYGRETQKDSVIDAFNWAIVKPGKYSKEIAHYLKRYMSGMNIEICCFKSIFEIALAELSVRELKTYGQHRNMDKTYLTLLQMIVENDISIHI